jgi:release factor glutamine methyltransferase
MIHKLTQILSPLLKNFYFWYVSKPRHYSYNSIHIIVNPGVFFPGFIKSTRILLNFLDRKDMKSKKVLELGAGSGIVSFLAASKGAIVTAGDINPAAIENINQNVKTTGLHVTTICSDLFVNIKEKEFDYIFINPPFYSQDPQNMKDMAWFCGSKFEFFIALFSQLKQGWFAPAFVYMILSEECDLFKIKQIAGEHQFELIMESKEIRLGEWFYVFRIINQNSKVSNGSDIIIKKKTVT